MERILVAYDGEEPARRALELGAELAQAFGAELALISVTPWRSSPLPSDFWDDAESRAGTLRSAAKATIVIAR